MKFNKQVLIQLLIFIIVILAILLLLDIRRVDGYYVSISHRYRHHHDILILIFLGCFWAVPWVMDKIKSDTSPKRSSWFKTPSPRQEEKLDITLDPQLQTPEKGYEFTDIQKSADATYVLNYKQKTGAKKVQFKAVDSNKNNIIEPDEIVDYRVTDK